MSFRRLLLLAGLAPLGGALSGCVAAAIPVVASGALLRTGMDGRDAKVTVQDTLETPASPAATEASRIASSVDKGDERFAGDDAAFFAGPAPAPTAGPVALSGGDRFAEFLAFSEATALAGASAPPSAILADPTALSGERKPCPGGPAAVLVDLDPPGGLLAPEPALSGDAGLAAGLARLRRAGVEIAWISGQSAAHAGALREALAKAKLDPDGNDTLLLMRYPGDRKQTRREDLAARTCLVAIAGDERGDFDELYDYLVNPEAALGLELLIGDGWFLVPSLSPSQQRPTP